MDARAFPAFPSGRPTTHPDLYFMGYTEHLRGHLYEANRDSRRLARLIKAYLREVDQHTSAVQRKGV